MTVSDAVLAAHTLATIAMAGAIWFVQVVHYPLLARVGAGDFARYAAEHVRRTTLVLAPLMLVEFATAVWLALAPPLPSLAPQSAFALALLGIAWVSTWAVQVPCHRRLSGGFDAVVIRRLVATNWLRTLAWTARAALAVDLAFVALAAKLP